MNTQQYKASQPLLYRVSASAGTALDIRCAWGLANVLSIEDSESPNVHHFDSIEDCLQEAEALGYRDGLASTLPPCFVGTALAGAWNVGAANRSECEESRGGTKEEWDALSPEAQAASWDSFDVLCARGIGDTHHFYQVLMKQCMVGYVGH
ncbi:TPA: hypothetical protein ACK3Q6_007024 [Burkholderia cepacia]|jgi:hypothetical protein|uniref:Uncharacterized protein n=2 Tax=Burkholderia cepacia complex TaxID=87882 RepID=A0A286P6K5_9BURK|nr:MULTISPECIES: hypothetical protein [Burkholderia]HDR9760283.1 hypothetical protein [Burkholderia cepacia ATCC 25416]MBR8291253.1 hypothetical protein [Burkholderia cenocepacia]MBX3822991.1 hypothetical protein [Burkholderia contaminans]MBX3843018.1 hypothetical protein [Burkholderia contaminans]MBX3860920.1 hypothetical protein [Burkholderia contaminans]